MTKRKKAKGARRVRGKPHAEPLPLESAAEIITTPVIKAPLENPTRLRVTNYDRAELSLQKPPSRNTPVLREEAERRTSEIKASAHSLAGAYLRVGMEVKACLDDRVPEALEMTAHEWMKECFAESVAKIYRAVRIVKSLAALPPARLAELTEGTAYSLSRLPEKIRFTEEWVQRAASLPNKDFEELVAAELENRSVQPEEKKFKIILYLPETLKQRWDVAIERAGEICELDLETRPGSVQIALEMILEHFNSTPIEILKAGMQ